MIECDRRGCDKAAVWREVVKLTSGGLAFYYYCAEHKPQPVTTATYQTVSITALQPGDTDKRQEAQP